MGAVADCRRDFFAVRCFSVLMRSNETKMSDSHRDRALLSFHPSALIHGGWPFAPLAG